MTAFAIIVKFDTEDGRQVKKNVTKFTRRIFMRSNFQAFASYTWAEKGAAKK